MVSHERLTGARAKPRSRSRSVAQPAATTRERILEAAAAEFAARGFDGAKVDRIAARARVNKAMLYYHFTNKAALYREILRDVFGQVAAAVADVRDAGGDPDTQLRAFVEAISRTALANPHFPPVWLREMADGGRHLDDTVVHEMKSVLGALATILQAGRRDGRFRAAHPLIVQLGIVGPLLLFAATAPVRDRYRDRVPELPPLERAEVLAYVQGMTLAGLTAESHVRTSSARRTRS